MSITDENTARDDALADEWEARLSRELEFAVPGQMHLTLGYTLDQYAQLIHKTAVDKGSWDKPRNFGEMLMLITSEVAKALEEHRDGNEVVYFLHAAPDCKYSGLTVSYEEFSAGLVTQHDCKCVALKPEGYGIELADALIRILDTLGSELKKDQTLSIDEMMQLKMNYNNTRSRLHGKHY